jgi:hypothetical protein
MSHLSICRYAAIYENTFSIELVAGPQEYSLVGTGTKGMSGIIIPSIERREVYSSPDEVYFFAEIHAIASSAAEAEDSFFFSSSGTAARRF